MTEFISQTVLKRDLFSATHKGYTTDAPDRAAIRRIVTASPIWTRPLAWWLARREIAALRAVAGIDGTPQLISVDAHGLVRTWTDGAPLHLARPKDRQWYADAFRLLRQLRQANITHNDLAKAPNWLMTPDGRAAVIDFQLASRHRRRGRLYKMMAYEDFRHLLRQMNTFAPELMTPTARRWRARRSWPAQLWMSTVKPVYNTVTRRIFHWSDGEGTWDRLEHEESAIRTALLSVPGVREVALIEFPLRSRGAGIYAFVETDVEKLDDAFRAAQDRLGKARADFIQPVALLPRSKTGEPRRDLLNLIALNQIPELEIMIGDDAELAALVAPIVANRLNFTDRRFK
ncbi:MAG: serine/threonine protein kinase [Rhizobiaceae bacterium]|nr:serine/threonine protein kinase [Rhizobiaceae bacterium]